MSERASRILALGVAARAPGMAFETAAGWADAIERLGAEPVIDAVLVDGDDLPASAVEIAAVAAFAALVVVVVDADTAPSCAWLRLGADDVLERAEVSSGAGWRRVRFAIERHRRAEQQPAKYSTEAETGLPHRGQLVEHLSQLLALREREPSPMAVLVLRVAPVSAVASGAVGDSPISAASASDWALLRRKVAVRLRVAVRASDVVAAIEDGVYAVLLGSILAAGDAPRVAAKLVAALVVPLDVAGRPRSLSVAFGIAQYPNDGRDAERLLRRALALAAAAPAIVSAGPAASHDGTGAPRAAANDDS